MGLAGWCFAYMKRNLRVRAVVVDPEPGAVGEDGEAVGAGVNRHRRGVRAARPMR